MGEKKSKLLPEGTSARMHESTKKRKNGSILTVVLAWALLGLSGCGYRVASTNRLPTGITTIAVLPFENETTTFKVEQVLTQSVIRSLVEKSSYRVTRDPAKAEGVLQGVISRVTANPVIFGEETFGSTFLVTLNVRVELRERQTGKILFKNDEYIFREQYIINVDVENFFSELNPALARIADDFGSSVVTTLLEGF